MPIDASVVGTNEHPHTPNPPSEPNSEHTTPSKSPNTNGKWQMQCSKEEPATHQGDHLKGTQGALECWHFKTQCDCYSPSSVTTVTLLLSDPALTTLALNAYIYMVEDIEALVNPPWIMA
jgi:hypothetical protein